jgi:hypothetical protein
MARNLPPTRYLGEQSSHGEYHSVTARPPWGRLTLAFFNIGSKGANETVQGDSLVKPRFRSAPLRGSMR